LKNLNLYTIVVFAIFLSACSKGDNPDPGQTEDSPRIKSISANGVAYATLAYNNKGQLTTIKFLSSNTASGGKEDKFTYDASGRLAKAVNPFDSTQYTYSADGRLQQSDNFSEWKLSTNGSGLDFRTAYTYNSNGKVASMTASNGTKQEGQIQQYTVTYDYNTDGLLSDFIIKYTDSAIQKLIVENGYTNEVKLNPLILERITSLSYYFGLGGIEQLTAKFPNAISYYEGGQVTEGYGFTFNVTDNKVTKLSALLKLPNSESTTNYEFQY
jgi:YD repeat-containing protein